MHVTCGFNLEPTNSLDVGTMTEHFKSNLARKHATKTAPKAYDVWRPCKETRGWLSRGRLLGYPTYVAFLCLCFSASLIQEKAFPCQEYSLKCIERQAHLAPRKVILPCAKRPLSRPAHYLFRFLAIRVRFCYDLFVSSHRLATFM